MKFIVLGANHKSASLETRERVSFSSCKILDAMRSLKEYPAIEECLVLSTCNRVELYALAEDSVAGFNSLKKFIYDYHDFKERIDSHFYFYEDHQAIKHIFRVAASLDSLIVGENQILHQVKKAYSKACDCGSVGKHLSVVFQKAFNVGKKVRAETEISKGAVSISSAAVELAKNILKDLGGKRILIIGAGKMGELTARTLADRGIEFILVANRTYQKALQLAEIFKGQPIHFSEIRQALAVVDIVISSTSAPHCILKSQDIASVVDRRGNRSLFIMDLGVPRNIDQSVSNIENVHLYNMDDLKKISDLNLQERLKEADMAEEIVGEAAAYFYNKVWEECLVEGALMQN